MARSVDDHWYYPRHAVRNAWNHKAVRKVCASNHQILFISKATNKGAEKTNSIQQSSRRNLSNSSSAPRLPDTIEVAIGMKVLVTYNIETNLDITNSARGTIVDIVLDSRESAKPNQGICHLQYLPRYLLVRLDRTKIRKLPGPEDQVIPIEPITKSMGSIQRTQCPITPAYAFTDYRQTIPYSIVDIAQPPNATLSLFNLYVALSRSPGREQIRILRSFKDSLLCKKHDPTLTEEEKKLERLNDQTRAWWNEYGDDKSDKA